MNERDLLNIILEDEAVREESLQQTLAAVRSRRRGRTAAQSLGIVCVLALLAILWSASNREVASVAVASKGATNHTLQIVHTRGLSPTVTVESAEHTYVPVLSGVTAVAVIETQSASAPFDQLGDEELLALVPCEVKLIVWRAPHDAELVCLGREDIETHQ
jgi:hypothetical protein